VTTGLGSRVRERGEKVNRECVKGGAGTGTYPGTFAWAQFREGIMSNPLHRAGCSRGVAPEDQSRSSTSPSVSNFDLIEFAGLCGIVSGLCGIAFCVAAGAELYLKNSHFWATEAIATTKDSMQIVNRSPKGDRLDATMTNPWSRSAGVQDGFGMLEVGGSLNATVTIRDAKGRLVFDLRRTTVISKRQPRGGPSSKEQVGPVVPKSRVVPVQGPGECDPSVGVSRIAALCAPSTEMRIHYSRMSEHYSSLAEAEELSMLAYGR
jgi:hypothetical protein